MSPEITQIVLAVIGSGGLIGGVVALMKLKPEANTAAVAQAGSVMEQMRGLNDELAEDRDRWKARALDAEHTAAKCHRRVGMLEWQLRKLGAVPEPEEPT